MCTVAPFPERTIESTLKLFVIALVFFAVWSNALAKCMALLRLGISFELHDPHEKQFLYSIDGLLVAVNLVIALTFLLLLFLRENSKSSKSLPPHDVEKEQSQNSECDDELLLPRYVDHNRTRGVIELDVRKILKINNLSIDKFQCLKDNGYMFFVGRIWKSLGEFDWDGLQNIKNAYEAGFYVSVYIFPCLDFPKCAPVQDQVEETINRLNDEGVKYGMVFLDIQMFDWPSNKEENRKTIDAMGQKLDEMGVEWGIYTNQRNWNGIVGDWDKWSHKKLWWAFWGVNDGERYSDFTPFGGWTDFYMQQYAGDFQGPCSVALNLDYYK